MPYYEYQCKKCGHTFEREHPIGEKKNYRCPECASSETQRIVSQVGIIFKGTGFYITDSRRSASERTAKDKAGTPESQTSKPEVPSPASEN